MGSSNFIKSVLVSVGIVLAYLVVFGNAGSVKKREESITLQIKELEQKLENTDINAQMGSYQELNNEVTRLRQDLQSSAVGFPSEIRMPLLLRDFSQIGDNCGLQFLLFEPQDIVDEGMYERIPIKVKLRGTFPQIGNFIYGVSRLPQTVVVEEVKIAGVMNLSGLVINEAEALMVTYRMLGGGQ